MDLGIEPFSWLELTSKYNKDCIFPNMSGIGPLNDWPNKVLKKERYLRYNCVESSGKLTSSSTA
jgi:hypothetical protein